MPKKIYDDVCYTKDISTGLDIYVKYGKITSTLIIIYYAITWSPSTLSI